MIEIVILAIVQGIAEFLPISSSGHLVILGALLGGGELGESPTLEVILHAGTLGSILVVFWRRILDLLSRDRRVIPLLVVGTLPAVVIGLTIKTQFEYILRYPILAGAMLLVTATMLVILGRLPPRDGEYQAMSWKTAFLIGCFQAFAILPGVSRSGSTILGGRLLGLKNDDSVTFSFLLAIPAILGATVLTLKDVLRTRSSRRAAAIHLDRAFHRRVHLVFRRHFCVEMADRLEPPGPAALVCVVVLSGRHRRFGVLRRPDTFFLKLPSFNGRAFSVWYNRCHCTRTHHRHLKGSLCPCN